MILSSKHFDHLSVIQLLQNVDDYLHVLVKEPYLYCNYTLEIYLKWCTDILFLKWPTQFPDLVYVLEKIEQRDFFNQPGASSNERRFYNLLLQYGK